MVQLFICHSDRHLKYSYSGYHRNWHLCFKQSPHCWCSLSWVLYERIPSSGSAYTTFRKYVEDWCEFSLKILHGDWFAGKGLGVVTLDFKGLNVHVRELNGWNLLPITSEEFLHQFCPKHFWPRCLYLISTRSTLGRRTSISVIEFFRWPDNHNRFFVVAD